MDYSNSFEQI